MLDVAIPGCTAEWVCSLSENNYDNESGKKHLLTLIDFLEKGKLPPEELLGEIVSSRKDLQGKELSPHMLDSDNFS
jgi:hypothetical protein